MKSDKKYTLFFENDWLEADQINHQFMDHTLNFGHGVIEEIRSFSGERGTHIFKASEHFERLILAAQARQMDVSFDVERLVQTSYQLLEKNELQDAHIHALIYAKKGEPKLVLTAKRAASFSVQENLKITTTQSSDAGIVSNATGDLVCQSSNPFFFIKDGVVYTPKLEMDTNPGIMRNSIIECAIALGHPVLEKSVSLNEVEGSEAVFFSNFTYPMNLVSQIDDYIVTDNWRNTIAMDLLMMFRKQVTNEDFLNHSII